MSRAKPDPAKGWIIKRGGYPDDRAYFVGVREDGLFNWGSLDEAREYNEELAKATARYICGQAISLLEDKEA